jgi:hypothetical protein
MGRGGDGPATSATNSAAVKKTTIKTKTMESLEKKYKLSDLSTEQLKQWCDQYGVKSCNGDRVLMLKELVSL